MNSVKEDPDDMEDIEKVKMKDVLGTNETI